MASTSQIAFLLLILGLLRGFLGFLAQAIVAHQFGAQSYTDSYFLSLNIPQVIGDFMIGGALIYAIVPVSLGVREKKGVAEQRIFHTQVLILIILATGILTLLYAAMASQILRRLAPGFNALTLETAIDMARVLSFLILLWGISYFFAGIFLIHKMFLSSALVTFLPAVSLISFCLLGRSAFGNNRLIYGTLTGACLQVLFGFLFAFRANSFAMAWPRDWSFPRKLLGAMAPISVGVILVSLVNFQQKFLASQVGQGAISCLNYAAAIYAIPGLLIFGSLQTVLYPKFSEQTSRMENLQNMELLARSIRFVFFLAIPVSALMIILRVPIVFLFFQRGQFDFADTLMASTILGFLLMGFFAQSSVEILGRFFYAEQKAWVYAGILGTGTLAGIILNPLFLKRIGIGGLTLSSAIVSVASCFSLLYVFSKRHKDFSLPMILPHAIKVIVMTFFPAVAVYFLYHASQRLMDMQSVFTFALLTGFIFLSGMGLYLLIAFFCGQPEAKMIRDLFRWRHWKKV